MDVLVDVVGLVIHIDIDDLIEEGQFVFSFFLGDCASVDGG